MQVKNLGLLANSFWPGLAWTCVELQRLALTLVTLSDTVDNDFLFLSNKHFVLHSHLMFGVKQKFGIQTSVRMEKSA